MGEKVCKKCGRSKPATTECFYENRNNKDGLEGKCKACRNMAHFLSERKKRLEKLPAHMTPRHIARTPEYHAYLNKRRMIYQRLRKARMQGRTNSIPILQAWLTRVTNDWYLQIARGE